MRTLLGIATVGILLGILFRPGQDAPEPSAQVLAPEAAVVEPEPAVAPPKRRELRPEPTPDPENSLRERSISWDGLGVPWVHLGEIPKGGLTVDS